MHLAGLTIAKARRLIQAGELSPVQLLDAVQAAIEKPIRPSAVTFPAITSGPAPWLKRSTSLCRSAAFRWQSKM